MLSEELPAQEKCRGMEQLARSEPASSFLLCSALFQRDNGCREVFCIRTWQTLSQHGRSTQPSPGHCCCRRPGLLLLALFSPSPTPLLNKPRAPRRALGGAWAVAARSPAGFAHIQPSTGNQHGPCWPPNLITKPLKMEQNAPRAALPAPRCLLPAAPSEGSW